jgi:hypothetical protein
VLDDLAKHKVTFDRAAFTTVYTLFFLLIVSLAFGTTLYRRVSPRIGGMRPVQVSVGLVDSVRGLVPDSVALHDKSLVGGLLVYQTREYVHLQVRDETVRVRGADIAVMTLRPEKEEPFWKSLTPLQHQAQKR